MNIRVAVERAWNQLQQHLSQSHVQSTFRAIGAALTFIVVIVNTRTWLVQSARASPLLAFNLMILIFIFLVQLWRKCGGDINVTALRFVLASMHYLNCFREEFFVIPPVGTQQANADRKKRNRKILRSAIFFMLVQNTLSPGSRFEWVHSLMAFEFSIDFYNYVIKTDPPNPVPEDNTWLPNFYLRHLGGGFHLGKGVLAANILFYQYIYLSRAYVLITICYFALLHKLLERPITRLVEFAQLEFFEGMEQYYVCGILAFVEVVLCFLFSLLILFEHKQYLMLLALYTNIYTSVQEFMRDNVNGAVSAWATLAQFDKATGEELREHNDICPICLCSMKTARRTACKHLFHGHCLRRALREKSACPMCTAPIKKP